MKNEQWIRARVKELQAEHKHAAINSYNNLALELTIRIDELKKVLGEQ